MAYPAHRHGDMRMCTARTTVKGQSSVTVNGKLWAVDNDPETHSGGNLIAAHGKTVTIEGKGVIVHAPDKATPDGAGHPGPPTSTAEGSGDVFAY